MYDRTCLLEVPKKNQDFTTKRSIILHDALASFIYASQYCTISHWCFIPYDDRCISDEFTTWRLWLNGGYQHLIVLIHRYLMYSTDIRYYSDNEKISYFKCRMCCPSTWVVLCCKCRCCSWQHNVSKRPYLIANGLHEICFSCPCFSIYEYAKGLVFNDSSYD